MSDVKDLGNYLFFYSQLKLKKLFPYNIHNMRSSHLFSIHMCCSDLREGDGAVRNIDYAKKKEHARLERILSFTQQIKSSMPGTATTACNLVLSTLLISLSRLYLNVISLVMPCL